MARVHVLLGALALLAASAAAIGQEAPFPAGESTQQIEGMKCTVVMPESYDLGREHSLVLILHGAGGSDTGMARSLAFLTKEDYVIVAPKSPGQSWSARDQDPIKRVAAKVRKDLNIGVGRLHCAGFSAGGWTLDPIALDGDLRFASACWIAAGFSGGKFPKHARRGMGVLALAGAEDPNRGAAELTVKKVIDKVRMAEVRIQPHLGHKWPAQHIPYYGWWLGVQEGRFVPGVTMAFEWKDDEEQARAAMTAGKTGGFVYWYAEADGDSDRAKTFQNDVLQDPAVRFFGRQSAAWKLERSANEEAFAALKLKETPAVAVYDAKGKLKKVLQGKIKARSLAGALRSVARTKKAPKR